MHESVVFSRRVHCRRKESSRSLSHLLMSFLSLTSTTHYENGIKTTGMCRLTYGPLYVTLSNNFEKSRPILSTFD